MKEKVFLIFMILGSIVGVYVGSQLLNFINSQYISIILGIILLISAWKVFKIH